MKANEFVKSNPWLLEENIKEMKEIISDANDMKFFCVNNQLGHSYSNHGGGLAISIDDLKRLVESWELVESYGGINECLDIVSSDENIQIVNNLRKASNQTQIDAILLKQAIADVESCQ